MKRLLVLIIGCLIAPVILLAQGNVPIDTSTPKNQDSTQSRYENQNEEQDDFVVDDEETYDESSQTEIQRRNNDYYYIQQQEKIRERKWERENMIAKGFKVGLVTTRGLSLKNVVTSVELNSGMLTGIEVGYANIPKVNKTSFFKGVSSLGFKTRFYAISGTFDEDPGMFDKDFTLSGLDVDLTYTVYPNTFLFVGFNVPSFSASGDEKAFGPVATLDFDSSIGLNFGAGYEITEKVLLELQVSSHSYDVKIEAANGHYLLVDPNLATLEYTLTNLALSYTF